MSSSLKFVGLHGLRSTISRAKIVSAAQATATTTVGVISTTRNIHLLLNPLTRVQTNQCTTQQAVELNCKPENCYTASNTKVSRNSTTIQQLRRRSFFHRYQNIMDAPAGIFKGSLDRFNGVTIDSNSEFAETDNFPDKLQKSLDYWKLSKRRGIWFKVKTEHSEWVPHLTKMGFEFHHAKNGFVVLTRWLPEDEYENIPVYAHTMLGVGGLVVNKNNEVLVVSERFSLIPDSWKLPGGYAEPKENIVDAAIREVREETGVECEFNTVISIRHSHGGIFGCSDIYCVVALTPKTLDLTRCEREIAKLQWMPVQEYLEHPNVHETNRHFMRCFLDYQKRGIRFTCEMGLHQILKKEYCLYHMKPIEEGEEQASPPEHKNGKL